MDFGLDDKVAAVAAASSGLGFAVALELAREGAAVAICSRGRERVETAVRAIQSDPVVARRGSKVVGVTADLASPHGPSEFVAHAAKELGRVDILIANNGGPASGRASSLDEAAWKGAFDLTFQSASRLVSAALPGMLERKWGRIIFVTSVSVKQPIPELAASSAMRSAVVGYAKCLSDEVASSGVTVNCVAPGSTATERLEALLLRRALARGVDINVVREEEASRIPVGRIGRPDEFAAAVTFLASARASFITGVVLPIDGGVVRSLS
jgi:3-oxoacyl-[acyl-carrier protein] reductase